MLIGVPKEIKNNEYRVGLTPAGVRELTGHGHQVVIQADAAHGIGLDNEDYNAVGAEIVDSAEEIFSRADRQNSCRGEYRTRGRNGSPSTQRRVRR